MSGDVGCFEGHELEQATPFGGHAFRRICLLTTRVSILNFTSIRKTSELWLMEDQQRGTRSVLAGDVAAQDHRDFDPGR